MKEIIKEQALQELEDLEGFAGPHSLVDETTDIIRRYIEQQSSHDHLYDSIEEFEKIVGHSVDECFKQGWGMGRITKNQAGIPEQSTTTDKE